MGSLLSSLDVIDILTEGSGWSRDVRVTKASRDTHTGGKSERHYQAIHGWSGKIRVITASTDILTGSRQ